MRTLLLSSLLITIGACRHAYVGVKAEDTGACVAAAEVCNDLDDDCDGWIDDDAEDGHAIWGDADGDGYGAGEAVTVCVIPEGAASEGGDCDDTRADVSPVAEEIWYDGVDQDCDGGDDYDADGDGQSSDEDCDDTDATIGTGNVYVDADGDGYGDEPIWSCEGPGTSPEGGDCDDGDAAIHPGAPAETVCDGVDTNCDGVLTPLVTFFVTDGTIVDETAALTGTASALAEATIEGDGTLRLCGGQWYTALTLTGAVDVVGIDAPTLDGAGLGVPLTSTGVALTVQDVNFQYGRGAQGGCLRYVGSSLTLSGVSMDHCTAAASGGGAYVEAPWVEVEESSFTNGYVEGDATYVKGGGLHIIGVEAEVRDSTFTDNYLDVISGSHSWSLGGGVAFVGTLLTVRGSTFARSTLRSDYVGDTFGIGGGVHAEGEVVIEDTTITDNLLTDFGGGGGAVQGTNVVVRNSTFARNHCGGHGWGGAIIGSNVLVEDSILADNTVYNIGGAIFATGAVDLIRSEITNNFASWDGGAVWNNGWTTIIDSTSLDNSSGTNEYLTSGECRNTLSNDYGGFGPKVSLEGCETEMTF